MRLSDLAKRGHAAEGEAEEEKLPPKSQADDSPIGESEPGAPSGVDERPSPPPEEEKGLSLSRILSTSLEREGAAASEKETPLDFTLESGEGEAPFNLDAGERMAPLSLTSAITSAAVKTSDTVETPDTAEKTEPQADESPHLPPKLTIEDPRKATPHTGPTSGLSAPQAGQNLFNALRRNLMEILQNITKKKRIRLDPLHPFVETIVSDEAILEELYRIALSTRGEENALSDHLIHVATFFHKTGPGTAAGGFEIERTDPGGPSSRRGDVSGLAEASP